jgi:hypothetical protein
MTSKSRASNQALTEPIVIAEWWKNRSKESIRVCLNKYEGHALIDVRTWYQAEGKLKPGKEFRASIKHLPRLAAEITKAVAKARELGLVDSGAGHE